MQQLLSTGSYRTFGLKADEVVRVPRDICEFLISRLRSLLISKASRHLVVAMRVAARPVAHISARPWTVPFFLCPFLASSAHAVNSPTNRHARGNQPRTRRLHIETARGPEKQIFQTSPGPHALPWSCPGCGALTQSIDPKEAGFYTTTRKSLKAYIANQTGRDATEKLRDDETYTSAVKNVDGALLKELGLDDVSGSGSGRPAAFTVWSTLITDSKQS